MFNLMRTHQRKFWLVITAVLIVSFVSFYSITDRGRPGSAVVVRIYGRDLSSADFGREARKFQLALNLGLTDFASSLGGRNDDSLIEFVINKLIVDHEGRQLGIQPSDAEIVTAIAGIPAFQTGGQFDRIKYEKLVQEALGPQGFTELEIQELVKSSLIFQRIKQIINSVPAVTDSEISYRSRMFQPVTGTVVLFDRSDFAKQVKLTEDQITKEFKAGAQHYVTPELRVANYVQFPMPPDLQKLDAKAKIAAQQKVADASMAFMTLAEAVGFEKAAAQQKLKIETTLPFDASGGIPSLKALSNGGNVSISGPVTTIAPKAFTLTTKSPLTGVLQGDDSFVVAELKSVTPSRPMTLEEARPEIVQELTDTAAKTALDKSVTDNLAKLRAVAQSGQPVAPAAAAAGLKTKTFTKVAVMDEKAPMDQRRYANAAVPANEREFTGFQIDENGGYAVFLEKREPADQKNLDQHRAELVSSLISQSQNELWYEWLQSAHKAANIAYPGANRG